MAARITPIVVMLCFGLVIVDAGDEFGFAAAVMLSSTDSDLQVGLFRAGFAALFAAALFPAADRLAQFVSAFVTTDLVMAGWCTMVAFSRGRTLTLLTSVPFLWAILSWLRAFNARRKLQQPQLQSSLAGVMFLVFFASVIAAAWASRIGFLMALVMCAGYFGWIRPKLD